MKGTLSFDNDPLTCSLGTTIQCIHIMIRTWLYFKRFNVVFGDVEHDDTLYGYCDLNHKAENTDFPRY